MFDSNVRFCIFTEAKGFFLMLIERNRKTMIINQIAKVLGISNDTSKRFFDLFCDTYIVHPLSRYGKLNERMVSPKKFIDAIPESGLYIPANATGAHHSKTTAIYV